MQRCSLVLTALCMSCTFSVEPDSGLLCDWVTVRGYKTVVIRRAIIDHPGKLNLAISPRIVAMTQNVVAHGRCYEETACSTSQYTSCLNTRTTMYSDLIGRIAHVGPGS